MNKSFATPIVTRAERPELLLEASEPGRVQLLQS